MACWGSGARYVGLGVEFVAAILGMALVGYWVDRRFDTAPWGLLVALAVGLIGGMYNFLRTALGAARGTSPAVQRGAAAGDGAAEADEGRREEGR